MFQNFHAMITYLCLIVKPDPGENAVKWPRCVRYKADHTGIYSHTYV